MLSFRIHFIDNSFLLQMAAAATAPPPEPDWGVDAEMGAAEAVPSTAPELQEAKLFGKWSAAEVTVSDIALTDYIGVKDKQARYLPHSSGRYQKKRFRKAQCPIAERLANALMFHGRNNGKKLMALRIVKHCFDIIYLLTGEVFLFLNQNI